MSTSTKSDRTRAALRQAAAACFREFGFQSATTAEIARRAGVAEGTLFLHYKNKLGLLTAVTHDFYDELLADGENAVAAPGLSTVDRIGILINGWTSRMASHWDLIQVFIQASQSHPDTELSRTVIQMNRRYTRLYVSMIDKLKIEGELPSNVPTTLLRDLLFGTLEHTARGQQYAGKPISTAAVGQQILALLLRSQRATDTSVGERLDAIEGKLDRAIKRNEKR
ncbi:MAG: TetR/AcrR family transcriptional regulator [Phreatobacter sp.]